MKTKILFIAVLLFIGGMGLTAQTNIQVMDFSIVEYSESGGTVELEASFKINQIQDADVVHLEIKSGSTVLQSMDAQVMHNPNSTCDISCNGHLLSFANLQGYIRFTLSQADYAAFDNAEMYVEDQNGSNTSTLTLNY